MTTQKLFKINASFCAFAFICILMSISSTAQAVTLSLGSINLSSAVASNTQDGFGFSAAATIDGDHSSDNGWAIGTFENVPNDITWNTNISSPTLSSSQSLDYYTYTIVLDFQWNAEHTIRDYSFSTSIDGGNTYNFVNTITSLSSTTGSTLTNTGADISATESSSVGAYTIVFTGTDAITNLRLNLPTNPGWGGDGNGNFVLTEVTGSATAEVVPEPSTYALITGLATLAFIAFRRKRSKA